MMLAYIASIFSLKDRGLEHNTYAFIIRIWSEATDQEGRAAHWRGSIDQVGSNKRLYFSDLEGIVRFIAEQIEGDLTRVRPGWRRWLVNVWHAFRDLSRKPL